MQCASAEKRNDNSGTEQTSDPVADEYLEKQKEDQSNQDLKDVPVRIDRTNDSDGEAFVITESSESDPDTEDQQQEHTKPLTEDEKGKPEGLSEAERKAEEERLAQLEKERKEKEEARRKEEERRKKEAELKRLKNEATYQAEAFANRQREFEMARKAFRIEALVVRRDARLGSVYPQSQTFWTRESEQRFTANPAFEVGTDQIYLVKLSNPLDYQSSISVNVPPGAVVIELKDPLAVWNRIKDGSGRWILMQKTSEGYVPLSLDRNGISYRVASVEIESGIVKLEIYSRSNTRRAGQYHILYPVELELIPAP